MRALQTVLEPNMTLNFTLNTRQVRIVALAYINSHILSLWKLLKEGK